MYSEVKMKKQYRNPKAVVVPVDMDSQLAVSDPHFIEIIDDGVTPGMSQSARGLRGRWENPYSFLDDDEEEYE